MPQLRPFHGIRYSSLDEIADLVCPPYDVISADEQIRLHERNPRNAVHLELARGEAGPEKYRAVAHTFRSWLDQGVLRREQSPALYVYRQDFVDGRGRRCRVAGVMGDLALEPLGSGILPHEKTMPSPIRDRLDLLRACPVNISPVYAVYRGGGALGPYFESLLGRPPAVRFADEAGTLHRLWVVDAREEIRTLASALRGGPLVIADGHHRYETALAFARERGGAAGGHDGLMCFCVDADCEDLCVLSYHRVLRTAFGPSELRARLEQAFGGKRLDAGESAAALQGSRADHPLLFVFGDVDLLVEVSDDYVHGRTGDRAPAWRDLDVVALHEAVLPDVLPDGVDEIRFFTEEAKVRGLVGGGWTAGVLLQPLAPTEVVEVARTGERMPQKASYFWPKALTGLVFREL